MSVNSSLVKLETSCTVILPPTVSVLWPLLYNLTGDVTTVLLNVSERGLSSLLVRIKTSCHGFLPFVYTRSSISCSFLPLLQIGTFCFVRSLFFKQIFPQLGIEPEYQSYKDPTIKFTSIELYI